MLAPCKFEEHVCARCRQRRLCGRTLPERTGMPGIPEPKVDAIPSRSKVWEQPDPKSVGTAATAPPHNAPPPPPQCATIRRCVPARCSDLHRRLFVRLRSARDAPLASSSPGTKARTKAGQPTIPTGLTCADDATPPTSGGRGGIWWQKVG
jgi:hypothetical protein